MNAKMLVTAAMFSLALAACGQQSSIEETAAQDDMSFSNDAAMADEAGAAVDEAMDATMDATEETMSDATEAVDETADATEGAMGGETPAE